MSKPYFFKFSFKERRKFAKTVHHGWQATATYTCKNQGDTFDIEYMRRLLKAAKMFALRRVVSDCQIDSLVTKIAESCIHISSHQLPPNQAPNLVSQNL
jgi:hypothetical protein